jgi:nitrite reductase/ring-hydroxylating ferredoxin subunit
MAPDLQDGGRAGVSAGDRRDALAGRRLCRVDDVPEGGGRGFRFSTGGDFEAFIVVRKGGALYAYVNACPHMGTPLDFLLDRFLDRDGKHLLCATHGARFRIEDGFCVAGPCAGKRLRAAAVDVAAGVIILTRGAAASDPPA